MIVQSVLMCALVLLVSGEQLNAGEPSSFRTLHSDNNGWVIEYTPPPSQFSTILIDSVPHYLFGFGRDDDSPGSPLLPVQLLTLGIPFGTHITARMDIDRTQAISDVNIAPIPTYTITDDHQSIPHYKKDPAAYQADAFLPLSQIIVNDPTVLRHQRMVSLRISPYRYNPATRTLERIARARIYVTLHQERAASSQLRPMPSLDPVFEETYRSLISNYQQARQWRAVEVEELPDGPDPGSWFETGREYYRIKIPNDGWYKITKGQLASAGANTSTIDTSSLRLYASGVSIPVHVLPDTAIEFFGRRNYGDTTYYDFYTDTSTYWLTWGGSGQTRFQPAAPPGGGSLLRSSRVTLHNEQNTDYYDGLGESEIIQPEAVAGEGWVWNYFYPNSTINYTFTVDSINYTGAAPSFEVRLFGITGNFPGIDHHGRFWLNDSLVGEVMFEARTEGRLLVTLPAHWLILGQNTLRVSSIPTTVLVNAFYLDWFEISYNRILRATNDQIVFNSDSQGGVRSFLVGGFTSPSIAVYDITLNRVIGGGIVTGNSSIGYSLQFSDSVSIPKSYVVKAQGGERTVPPLEQKVFTDIRTNPQGADYIIISHKNFLPSAVLLAAHRQNVNGIRTAVVDVQDIYDEFNYGVLNAERVKDFLSHAFTTWTGPAPAYLLLLGDASWDYHRYMSSTIKTNYVPAYGVPAGDNWYASFNPTQSFVPSMLVGRIPAEDPIQAARTVAKIIQYDSYMLAEWNKKFMFVSGGSNPSEQLQFNGMSDNLINQHVLIPPIGGTPSRVYKSVQAVIDENNKEEMRSQIKDGIIFLNYLGHSGGRIWGVDVGDPSTLENTNGMLPFVSSVSCNVGAFAEPSGNVLSEDFVMADNRGAVGMWASSAVGYAGIGTDMVNFFLSGMAADSVREFGALTTTARYRMWQVSPSSTTRIASMKLNPLLGDPLSKLAIPTKPDLAITNSGIRLLPDSPTPNDSVLVLRLDIDNYGLVPGDSIDISLTDLHGGNTTPIVSGLKIPPLHHKDSIFVPWDASFKVGLHTISAVLDPMIRLDEVTNANNSASTDKYVYANNISIVKPIESMVVSPGVVDLVVSSPRGLDSTGYRYYFEFDTTDSFDSPFFIQSAAITPGPVSGSWTTPNLADNLLYFWRVRTNDGSVFGNWVASNFSTSSSAPVLPAVRWRQFDKRQLARGSEFQTTATDSGVTIAPSPPVNLYVRSVGYRGSQAQDYYSMIILNALEFHGHWWTQGNSFMALRLDGFTGGYVYRAFNVQVQSSQADSLKKFINITPPGQYVAIAVIQDGFTNVSESLYTAIESLGSTQIRSVVPGQSWVLVSRKGSPAEAMEQRTNDSAVVNLVVPNYFRYGEGSIAAGGVTIPSQWQSLQWQAAFPQGTDVKVGLIGVRESGSQDTLGVYGSDSTLVNLQFLNGVTSGPTYSRVRPAAFLSSTDATRTPRFQEWSIDLTLPADLAVSSQTIGTVAFGEEIERGSPLNLPISVHNIGFQGVDSARIIVSMYDKFNKARPLAYAQVDTIPVNGMKTTVVPITTTEMPRRVTLEIAVAPSKRYKDLLPDNNKAYYSFVVSGSLAPGAEVFADGVRIVDGDYVRPRPSFIVRSNKSGGTMNRTFSLFANNKSVPAESHSNEEAMFTPELVSGDNTLIVRTIQTATSGELDSVEMAMVVRVLEETKILNVFNYPNPFGSHTEFTLVITGVDLPDELSIQIFTVAGRKLQQLTLYRSQLQIGFNRIPWDGRDSDGDEIANGTYFYKVSAKAGGKQESVLQRMVKLR